MEHRCDRRVDRQLSVIIHTSGRATVRATTQNISCGGLYLKTGAASALKKNALVKLTLIAGERRVTLPALVLRCEDNAAALMFVEQAASRLQAVMGPVARSGEAQKAGSRRLIRAASA
jgi:hypothetical protein